MESEIFTLGPILLQILLIDLVLAGDNAVVIGLAVNGLPAAQRRVAILAGIGGATVVRVGFALVALKMLALIGLTLAGGVLLLWVVWKAAREIWHGQAEDASARPAGRLRTAILRIIVADISMSLDNVLAVAGAARGHKWLLVVGLVVSVGLMGLAASVVARLLARLPWLAWVGLGIVFYVAVSMIYQGGLQVMGHV
jgi:YjbE family integral membrane protein